MTISAMHIILAIAFVVIAFSFYTAHKSHALNFNAFDLVMNKGKVDKIAVAFMLVLGVTTWVIIDLQVNGKLTEGYFTMYGGLWVTPLVAKVVFNKSEPEKKDDGNRA
jgi:hypothetical protein